MSETDYKLLRLEFLTLTPAKREAARERVERILAAHPECALAHAWRRGVYDDETSQEYARLRAWRDGDS